MVARERNIPDPNVVHDASEAPPLALIVPDLFPLPALVKSKGALGDAGDAETRFPGGCVVNATQQPEREERWPRERARARRG